MRRSKTQSLHLSYNSNYAFPWWSLIVSQPLIWSWWSVSREWHKEQRMGTWCGTAAGREQSSSTYRRDACHSISICSWIMYSCLLHPSLLGSMLNLHLPFVYIVSLKCSPASILGAGRLGDQNTLSHNFLEIITSFTLPSVLFHFWVFQQLE